MIKLWSGAALVLAFVQADPVLTEAAKGYKNAWSDFGEGSTVTYRESTRLPEIDEKGNLVHRDLVAQVVWTVTGVTGERCNLRVARDGQDQEFPYHMTLPHWFRGKAESKARESVVVGGRTFDCAVTTIAIDPGKDASQVTTLWKAADAPSWAVRVRNETFLRGTLNTSEDERLVAVEERIKVGDREIACHVVEVTTEAGGLGKTVRKEWRSPEVPGRVVRRETRQFQGGKEITLAYTQMEVVRFTKK